MITVERASGTGLLSTLRQRDFGLLWTGGLISNLGSWATFIAVPIFVYQQTGSALAATMIFTVTVVPMLLGSVAGVLVDRWDRRRTLVSANIALAALTLPLLAAHSGELWIVYASSFGLALTSILVPPAENALLPRLVGRDRLPAANSLNALNDNLGRIAGPAVGGGLMALGGFTTVIIFNACTFVVAAALIWSIRPQGSRHVDPRSDPSLPTPDLTGHPDLTDHPDAQPQLTVTGWRGEWLAGLASIRASTIVTVIFAAAATALLGDAILSSLLAPFVAETLASGGAVLGLFLTIRGVGGVIGGLISPSLTRRMAPRLVIGWSLLGLGIAVATLTLIPLVPVALIMAGFLGIFVVNWSTNQQTLIQTNIADAYLGRAYGVLGTITALAMIIGSLLAGGLAETLGVPPLLYGAAACYVAAALIALLGPTHQKRQSS